MLLLIPVPPLPMTYRWETERPLDSDSIQRFDTLYRTMKLWWSMKIYLIIILLLSASVTFGQDELTEKQAEVWKGEELYWEYVNNTNTEAFLELWHEDFIGWPCGTESTSNLSELKVGVATWFEDVASNKKNTTIRPEGVIVKDDFAITYLSAVTMWNNKEGAEQIQKMKLVHTWIKTDDGWKIVGGMCGGLE